MWNCADVHDTLLMSRRKLLETLHFDVPDEDYIFLIERYPLTTEVNVFDEHLQIVEICGESLLEFEIISQIPER